MTVAQTRTGEPDAAMLREIEAAISQSDFSRASQLAGAELAAGRVHPSLYSARAMGFEREKSDTKALADYRRALLLSPKNVVILNAIGLCLMRLARFDESVQIFEEAIRCMPSYAESHVRKGTVLRMAGNMAMARLAYTQALKLDPKNTGALACLATMAAQDGDAPLARMHAERALKLDQGQATAAAALALADMLEGEYVRAEERARAILQNRGTPGRASVLGILGDALDAQDRVDEAFAAYTGENMELLRSHAVRFAGNTGIAEMSEKMRTYVEREPALSWRGSACIPGRDETPACHVFLMGFFRSGTTLLEQALEAHSEALTLDERDFLEEPAERYLTHAAGLSHLAALADAPLKALRDDYWRRVERAGLKTQGKVFIDKHPLNTLKLLLISKLFPDAKVIFAIRDPRDVVLSCFRRHFRVNAAMYELLTLHGAARSYDCVMKLADALRSRISNSILDHRYEDMVDDFETSLRRVCAFLGIGYEEAMKDFTSVVRRDAIRSPSAMQVRRSLYRESVGQWRRYATQLAPVLPTLSPWVQRFSYSPD